MLLVAVCLAKLIFNLKDKVVASCAARRIKRTPSWRSQNERPVKTGARMVRLGHTRHYFVSNIKLDQEKGRQLNCRPGR